VEQSGLAVEKVGKSGGDTLLVKEGRVNRIRVAKFGIVLVLALNVFGSAVIG
jgi:hypothetical protein